MGDCVKIIEDLLVGLLTLKSAPYTTERRYTLEKFITTTFTTYLMRLL